MKRPAGRAKPAERGVSVLPTKKRVLSAAQPTGEPHIGNYLGAFTQWVTLQEAGHECFFPIVDLHAVTVPYRPETLPDAVLTTAALYLAVGVDPKKSTLFVQSHVSAHAEAAWLLTTLTPVGELERMTQYKGKTAGQKTVLAGLLNYPVLMAADILLYDTDLVPVGEDQLQHLEFARTLARKFNRQFGEAVKEPRAHLLKETARVMSLQDPTRKMSKSDPRESRVGLLDPPDIIRRNIQAAVTDSAPTLDPKNVSPALHNLLDIFAGFSGKPWSTVATEYAGRGYTTFKKALAGLLIDQLQPIRQRALGLLADREALYQILARGAERAAPIAYGTLARMKERMGLLSASG